MSIVVIHADHMGIEINGIKFEPVEGADYIHDYYAIAKKISEGVYDEKEAYRELMRTDLWFLVYFGLGVSIANHPFWVQMCRMVQEGPQTSTLDLWAREHGKSTIITIARSIQRVINDPEERIAIFSYKKGAAAKFLGQIKELLERSDFLKYLFDDIFFQTPEKEAPTWNAEALRVKRSSFAKENTWEAHGLVEGMPTGGHFTLRIYDDIETEDLVATPDQVKKLRHNFFLSQNLGTYDGEHWVIGTHYSHKGILNELRYLRSVTTNELLYKARVIPATVDGSFAGKSRYLPEERLDILRADRHNFNCQQLLNPTPAGDRDLDFDMIEVIPKSALPRNLYKFIIVDAAGSKEKKNGDAWGILLIGVSPNLDALGASDWYILGGSGRSMKHAEAINSIVDLYCRSGKVHAVAVEKVGMSSTEIHIKNALRQRKRFISEKRGTLKILRPGGRRKEDRIVSALQYPLENNKIKALETVDPELLERIESEMNNFPHWHDDVLDALSYTADVVKDFPFMNYQSKQELAIRERYTRYTRMSENNWMGA